jgi:hypothetical protein
MSFSMDDTDLPTHKCKVEETLVSGENHCQTLSHNVVSSTPRLSGIQTQNFSGDRHRLQFVIPDQCLLIM